MFTTLIERELNHENRLVFSIGKSAKMVKSVAIITISDTCYKDKHSDTSGPALTDTIKHIFPAAIIYTKIIPDIQEMIESELRSYSDNVMVDLILTTGGTGLSPRDVTPEATKAVIQKDVPAITTALTLESLKKTEMAMLSRAVAGIRNSTLIINFPGSKKAVIECFEVVKPILSHAIALLKNEIIEVKSVHKSIQTGHICPHKKVRSSVDVSMVAFRPRISPYPMVQMSEAWKLVDEEMRQFSVQSEIIPIEEGFGRIVAETLYTKEPMPPFPASVKDGYACLSADGAGVRRVQAALAAGDAPLAPLSRGECARINTGAALPAGADCVVQVEDTELLSASDDGQTEFEVKILVPPQLNQDVRPIGFDIAMGTTLAVKGDILDAGQIGVLAGGGYQKIRVIQNPKVALLSTGNELQEPSEDTLRPAHIRDSNRTMLRVLLKEHGYESIDCGIARDEPDDLVAAIAGALQKADVLVCTGGVSMGDRDLLKPVLIKDFNATIHYGRVHMKPGKPSTFATCRFEGRTKYIFALPGNPVSAYVCCLLFVVRALRTATAGGAGAWPRLAAQLSHDVRLDPRPEYARASIALGTQPPTVTLLGNQCSSRLLSACGATVLVELPEASDYCLSLPAGTEVFSLIVGRLDQTTAV